MKRLFRTALPLIAAMFLLSGCGAANYTDDEDMSLTKEFGETVDISYSFSFILIHGGPYELQITPIGLTTLDVNGKNVDCVEVQYRVLSTEDGNPADFANCLCATNFLNENLETVKRGVWYTDRNGTEVNVRGSLDIGVDYTFYVPIEGGFADSNLTYVTVSDRSGYYERTGNTYWYRV